MAALTEFFSHLYTMTVVVFTLLLLEIVILIRSITGGVSDSEKRLISTTQYLKFIEEKNPTIIHSTRSSSMVDQSSSQCTVCLSELEEGEKVRKLKCKHTFHKDCLDRWLQQYWATCPLCRTKVLPDEIVSNYHRLQNQVEYDGSDEEMIFFLSALHDNSLHRLF
ncbi:E3 ubiquitin-protein ligase RHA2A [Hibiscus syriacus]|uniref:E3 ubiquitin-protein ligase RHA2A n=1 Tax=Hibiscus syriacus TaxID=106335 RepID=A0A6A3AY46_HIBSY|nr:probable E3 ubiquitin-protein ligase XERICO [Hibiscus syriacus]XP_038994931.1 probable E3 ubiquitin-protein ligase XERICO [Hibiscus syriacus]KAE8709441.1 E3 ubiquitin-protein ligase RHA2A [Hibiscus syriacus]